MIPLYYTGFTIIPKHIFENIPVADIPAAPESLDAGKVIGTGPFKFTEMIEREQYILEKHEDYWQGEPNLDKLVWKIVDGSVMTGLLEKGEIDFIALPGGIDPADFEMVNEYENITVVEQPDKEVGTQNPVAQRQLQFHTHLPFQSAEIRPGDAIKSISPFSSSPVMTDPSNNFPDKF